MLNRTAAVAAEAARRLGRPDECRRLANQALSDFPQVFRLLKIRIPIELKDDGSPLARRLAAALRSSPRFSVEPGGFPLEIRTEGKEAVFEMYRSNRTRHLYERLAIGDDETQTVDAALNRFYRRLMSPVLDLMQADIHSLDGSPVAVQSQHAVDSLLDVLRPRKP